MVKAKNRHSSGSGVTPLADIGITKTQSSRWQRIAKVPQDAFREYVARARVEAGRGFLLLQQSCVIVDAVHPAVHT